MSPVLFISSFFIAFSGAMMPGPLLTATIGASARRGPAAGPLFIAGHGILELALLCALLYGLGPFLTATPVFIGISLCGAGIMLFMAIDMLRNLPKLTLHTEKEDPKKGSLIGAGILLSISNPYWTIWWGTIGLSLLVRAQKTGTAGVASFFSGHILGDLVWYSLISVAVWKGRDLLTDKLYRIVIGVCGITLGCFGLYFLVSGLNPLIRGGAA